jgi:hypothetical protein
VSGLWLRLTTLLQKLAEKLIGAEIHITVSESFFKMEFHSDGVSFDDYAKTNKVSPGPSEQSTD